MTITVKLFAILKDKAGVSEVKLDLPENATAATAVDAVAKRFPPLRDYLPRVAHAINREYAPAHTPLDDGDELALIPPVSGGAG